jgi:Zn-dependent peptidase ImmA (M78 family)/transcriptional regulator with XRE-family HTH domain
MPDFFNHTLMEIAREAAGMSQEELSITIDCSQATISRWEHGLFRPSDYELDKLCKELGRTKSFFAREDSLFGGGLPIYYHRALATTSTKTTAQVNARCFVRAIQIEILCNLVPQFEQDFPVIPSDHFHDGVKDVASAIRAKWGVGSGPIHNLIGLLESRGGVVIIEDMGCNEIDALCWWRPGLPKLFFLNARKPACRMRFSLAHELGHTVMHTEPTDPRIAEDEAQLFAGEFLMPARDAKASLSSPLRLSRIATLKPWWKISIQAIAKRAKECGAITNSELSALMKEISARGWRKREPIDVPHEQPHRFSQLLRYPLDVLDWSLEELAEALYTTVEDLQFLLGSNLPLSDSISHEPSETPALRLVGH